MEFRLFVPILPIMMILIVWLVIRFLNRPAMAMVLIGLVFAGSIYHSLTYETQRAIGSIEELVGYMDSPNGDWIDVGTALGQLFVGEESVVTIAVKPAGAIPYYSGLYTIDMLGLNDEWVARHGSVVSSIPGHQRLASLEYLLERDVNLVIGHPQIEPLEQNSVATYTVEALNRFSVDSQDIYLYGLPDESRVLEIPINSTHKVSVLYLVPSDYVDDVIRVHDLVVYPIDKTDIPVADVSR